MMDSHPQATFTAEDDRFHPAGSADPAVAETIWWNFYVPEQNLDAEIYVTFRPNLGVAAAGIYVWDDFCRHYTDMRYFDGRSYLPIPDRDLDDIDLGNGLAMRVLSPLERYAIRYDGHDEVSLELEFSALAPPVGFLSASADAEKAAYAPGHFDQVGRMTGELRLNGGTTAVDCITQRDRSWGAIRKEDPGYPPDVDWQSAHFGDDLWIQCWLWHEDPVSNALQGGVIYKQGRLVALAGAERRTRRDPTGIEAREIELRLRDVEGEQYLLTGRVTNMFPWPGWLNMVGFAGLVQWDLNGRTGWGEVHDGRTVAGTIAQKRANMNKGSSRC